MSEAQAKPRPGGGNNLNSVPQRRRSRAYAQDRPIWAMTGSPRSVNLEQQGKIDQEEEMGRDRRQRRRRAAVVGGAVVAAKKHKDAKDAQQQAAAAQPAASAGPAAQGAQPAAATGLSQESMEELKQLGELHEQNVLTDEEFEREKAKLLGRT